MRAFILPLLVAYPFSIVSRLIRERYKRLIWDDTVKAWRDPLDDRHWT